MHLLSNLEIKKISGGVSLEATFVWTIYGIPTDCVLDYISNNPATGLKDLNEIFHEMDKHCINRPLMETSETPELYRVLSPYERTFMTDYRALTLRLL